MPAVPNSIASLPLKALRETLAHSSAFQALLSADSNIDALDSIFYVSTANPLTVPYAVVDVISGEWEKIATGAFDQRGRLEVIIRAAIVDSADAEQGNEAVTFLNIIGDIIGDLLALAAAPDCFLNISGITHSQPVRPRREARKSLVDFYEVVITVEYEGGL